MSHDGEPLRSQHEQQQIKHMDHQQTSQWHGYRSFAFIYCLNQEGLYSTK